MSSSKPVVVSSAQAQDGISTELRNNIYSALLSGTGIKNIEATLEHEMQASGWTANLKAYITHLLRSGECTTLDEVQAKVHEKIKQSSSGAKPNGVANGVNGTNGHSKDAEDHNLQIPDRAVREGVRVVRRELEKVCDITVEDDKTADSASESHERNSRRGDRKPILKINPPKPPTTTRGSPVKNMEKKGSPSIAREVLINQLNEPESTGIGVEAGSDSDIPLILRKPLKRPAPRLEFVNTTQDDYKEE